MALNREDISFGPEEQEWHYSQAKKTYDTSRASSRKLTVPATEGPKETFVTIDPESSALVVVDMQNFFLDAECMDHPNGLKAVEPTIRVIEKCREIGIQVNYCQNQLKVLLGLEGRLTLLSPIDNLA